MKLGVMQPYFFPYIGHFALIDSVDRWVVFDVTQYTPKTWMNRNRILHPKEGWQYITIPLRNSSISIKTHEARLLNIEAAKQSICGQLSHYKKKAPYYNSVLKVVENTFLACEDDSLVHLNISSLNEVCNYLGIQFDYQVASELDFNYPEVLGPGDWAPFIAQQLGASQYVNPISGSPLFNVESFRRLGMELFYSSFSLEKYDTKESEFISGLSVLDVMMWNSPEQIRAMLTSSHKLTKAG